MVIVYKTRTCAYCQQVEKLLQTKNIDYKYIYLDSNPILRQKLFEQTGSMTVPITFSGDNFVVGWNVTKLLELIKK